MTYLILPILVRPGVHRPVLLFPRVGGLASLMWRSPS